MNQPRRIARDRMAIGVLLAAASVAAQVCAQVEPAEPPEDLFAKQAADWVVQLEPLVWYASPSGKLRLPGGSGTSDQVKIEDLNLDSPRFGPAGEVTIRGGKWRFIVNGGAYSIDREETNADRTFNLGPVAAAPGDVLDVSFDYTLLEADVGYRIWDRDFAAESDSKADAVDCRAGVDLIGGVRMQQFDISVMEVGASGGADEDRWFFDVVAGARGEIQVIDDITIDLQMTVGGGGGDGSSASLDLALGFQYRFTEHIAAEIGWRQVAYWLSDGEGADEFEYNGRMAGLFAGVSIRF